MLSSGCAGIEPPNPQDIIRQPLGQDGLRPGMTKNEVIAIWGEPDTINKDITLEPSGKIREEWIYHARYEGIPVDKQYFSKTKYLYFDGNNLTDFK